MKKYFLFIVLFFGLFSFNANALLPIGLYGGIRVGENLGRHSSDKDSFFRLNNSPVSAGAVVGIKLLDFRFELEYAYKMNAGIISNGAHDKKFNMDLKMFNVYYNFFDFLMFKLYVNAGVGKYGVKTSLIEKDNSTAWNVGIGANVSILDMLNADVGIRHVELGKMRFDNRSSKLSFEEIYAGIRFGF